MLPLHMFVQIAEYMMLLNGIFVRYELLSLSMCAFADEYTEPKD